MSKLRKILLTALITCLTVCVAVAVAACGGKSMSPNFRNSGTVNGGEEYRGKYVISVKSIGGLSLSNVTVSAVKNGEVKMTGISSSDGLIEFGLPSDEYQLVVDEEKLPQGYFIPAGTTFRTTADKERAEVVISSKVISNTMTSGTKYALGDIMHNFSFTNTYGAQFTLEELFETKRVVVLNFWYVQCPACVAEFPALEAAYKSYADTVSVVALNYQDDAAAISKFQSEQKLTFHLARDNAGITNAFSVSAFPTTVFIDRYGVIAEVHSSSIPQESTWKALFNKYSSDDYTQDDPSNSDNPETPSERTKFDGSVEMPASSEFKANVLGEGTEGKVGDFTPETNEKDVPYTWPWIIGEGGGYMTASNSKVPYSYATIYMDITLNSGDALSYEYKVDTEAGCDVLYALVNRQIVGQHSGNSTGTSGSKDGWVQNYGVYVADHTVTISLSFIYIKDPLQDTGTDTASIRNITITDVTKSETAIDQRIAVIDGKTLNNGSYGIPEDSFKIKDDGYYYYTDEQGEEYLLLANIIDVSPWSERHFGADSFTPDSAKMQPSSLYHISYWYMSNYESAEKDRKLKFNYGDEAVTDTIITNYYLQQFSDNQLTPLTQNLKNAIIEFAKAYAEEHKNDGDKAKYAYYDDQWLEFCYFYRHFGNKHDVYASAEEDKDNCYRYKDPVKGLKAENAYNVVFQGSKFELDVNKTKIISSENGSGLWYKITLPS
ncbi:MAG: TlpA family protein disulfide reductase, partial [Clostridia bacterium]|nr:TlpA family protein disulfide reductase [Clostridia bacterium]